VTGRSDGFRRLLPLAANTAGLPGLEWLAAIDGTVGEVALLPG
jgi:hypothetical protein